MYLCPTLFDAGNTPWSTGCSRRFRPWRNFTGLCVPTYRIVVGNVALELRKGLSINSQKCFSTSISSSQDLLLRYQARIEYHHRERGSYLDASIQQIVVGAWWQLHFAFHSHGEGYVSSDHLPGFRNAKLISEQRLFIKNPLLYSHV